MLPPFFSPRWRWPTVAVILGMIFLTRLGAWQLDRLEWRRGLNAQKAAELALPPLSLNDDLAEFDLPQMANRQVTAAGTYDYINQFVVESQVLNGQPGRYLVTPLLLDGRDEAVLVNRGWIPAAESDFSQFDSAGDAEVFGYIQPGETLSGGRQTEISAGNVVYRLDVAAIGETLPYPILPVYILQPPSENPDLDLPYQIEPDLSLDEGSHLSYAIQWFSFSLLLGGIYWYYVKKNSQLPIANSQ